MGKKLLVAATVVILVLSAMRTLGGFATDHDKDATLENSRMSHDDEASSFMNVGANDPCQACPVCPTSTADRLFDDPIIENLAAFSAASLNDKKHKKMWIEGAGLFIPLLNEVLEKGAGYTPSLRTCDFFHTQDLFTEKLGQLYDRYGSDKASFHDYHKVYGHLLQKLDTNKPLNLLEIGMGTNNPDVISSMGIDGKPGASLRAFRDALPRANIYGADIDEDILFTEERIMTMQVDQMQRLSFVPLGENERMFDLIIDDGLHSTAANLNTMLWAMDHTRGGGYIVIEDIQRTENWNVIDFIMSKSKEWEGQMVMCEKGGLYVLRKLNLDELTL